MKSCLCFNEQFDFISETEFVGKKSNLKYIFPKLNDKLNDKLIDASVEFFAKVIYNSISNETT